MNERAYDRFTPLAGVISVLALIAGFALGADEPDAGAPAATAVAYWSQNADKEMLISSIFGVSAATLVVFGAALREAACVAAAGRERPSFGTREPGSRRQLRRRTPLEVCSRWLQPALRTMTT